MDCTLTLVGSTTLTFSVLHQQLRDRIIAAAERHGCRNVRVFGSVARDEADPNGDVDFLVDLDADRSLFDLIDLQDELSELLQRRVDVVSSRGMRQRVADSVLREARLL